uniref:Pyrin domain-containing protein n=1 Tax=Oncorhynchus tshawytscha TaxID=74940 RepID=A0AAZ3QLL3_ONCTS
MRKEGLVMRRPSMMDVPALLLTGLEELTEEQLKTFQFYLTSVQLLGFPPIPERQLENTDRQVTVDQIVKRYDPEGAVRITLKILKGMNLDDLAEKLERDYIRVLLLTTLQELTEDQLKKFQSSGRMLGFPPIPERQLENTDRQDTVYQMVKSYGPERAVRNTIWILRWMKRHDVAQKLERDHTRATTWWRDSSDSDKWRMRKEGLVMRRPSMLDVPALLLTGLEELTEEQLKIFQFDLSSDQLPGFPPIPESQLENTDRQNTVDQMVKRYGPEGAVRNTLKILRRMNLDDLAEKLERDHTRGEPSGPEEAVEITPEILKKMNWDDLSKKIERERFPEDFEPEDYDQEDNGTYRFQCPSAGLFQCSITGLVFKMEGEGEVLYRTVPWAGGF